MHILKCNLPTRNQEKNSSCLCKMPARTTTKKAQRWTASTRMRIPPDARWPHFQNRNEAIGRRELAPLQFFTALRAASTDTRQGWCGSLKVWLRYQSAAQKHIRTTKRQWIEANSDGTRSGMAECILQVQIIVLVGTDNLMRTGTQDNFTKTWRLRKTKNPPPKKRRSSGWKHKVEVRSGSMASRQRQVT